MHDQVNEVRQFGALALLVLLSASVAALAAPPDFEFRSGGSCGGNEVLRKQSLKVRRLPGGKIQARIVYTSFCVDEDYAPQVDYQESSVQLRVHRNDDELTLHCLCTTVLTFKLTREVRRGTPISFAFGSDEPHLHTVAP